MGSAAHEACFMAFGKACKDKEAIRLDACYGAFPPSPPGATRSMTSRLPCAPLGRSLGLDCRTKHTVPCPNRVDSI